MHALEPANSPTIRPGYPEPLWMQAINLINADIASGVLDRPKTLESVRVPLS